MQAEILSYSRTQGLFAGVNLSGGVVAIDTDDTRDLYGRATTPRTILRTTEIAPPPETAPFMNALRDQATR